MAPALRLPRASLCGAGLLCAVAFTACGRSDDEIASDVRARLAADSSLQGVSVSVVVKKGVVLLRGRATAAGQLHEAAARVGQVGGVHTVINQLTLSDEGIRSAVEHALGQDSLLARVPIAVTVANGVVTLSSDATGADQRARAVAVTRAVPGVAGVEDHMK